MGKEVAKCARTSKFAGLHKAGMFPLNPVESGAGTPITYQYHNVFLF